MRRAVLLLLLIAFVLLLGYLFYVAGQIQAQSVTDDARPADVIIVMGAAEYRGHPSPVLAGRLDHALVLYLKGMAPYILTTGGAGGDPKFTEADVGRVYLSRRGVASKALLTENRGATTSESLDGAAETMRRLNLHSCIVVSDGYHIYRVKRFLQARGIVVYGSPRPRGGAPESSELHWLYFKQAVGFILWQLGIEV